MGAYALLSSLLCSLPLSLRSTLVLSSTWLTSYHALPGLSLFRLRHFPSLLGIRNARQLDAKILSDNGTADGHAHPGATGEGTRAHVDI